jgi:hypothetical protein
VFDRPLTIPAVSKRAVRTLFADESFSNSLVSAGVRPFGARVSGNLQPHPLHSYPLRATDAAMRGLFISTVNAAIALAEVACAFNIRKACHWSLNKTVR